MYENSHTKALLDICLSGGSGVSVFGDLSVIPFAVGLLKPFYSAYSLLICFKYKNNLVDTPANISSAALNHLLKRLYQY